ncbi:MAG: hypothetical protein ACLR1M_12570 [Oscillospiraceae bacterium]
MSAPTLFPAASPVAQTNGTGNLVTLRGARFGELSFSGAGAGGYPTGSSVLSDCVDVYRWLPELFMSRGTRRSTSTIPRRPAAFTCVRAARPSAPDPSPSPRPLRAPSARARAASRYS